MATRSFFAERDPQRRRHTPRQDVLHRTPEPGGAAHEVGVDGGGCCQGDSRQPDQRARQDERGGGKCRENPGGSYRGTQRGTSTEDRAVRTASGSENLSSSASGLSTRR
jgi:hypothetical protein